MQEVPFYPRVDYEKHEALKKRVEETCRSLDAQPFDVVGYHQIDEEKRWEIARNFTNETLWLRALPDIYILPESPPGFFLDAKTKAIVKYRNISIELSSFYWTCRRNMPDSAGIRCLHFYATEIDGQIHVFSPLLVKVSRIVIPLSHWTRAGRVPWEEQELKLFRHYAECIRPEKVEEKEIRRGTGDPFVLIPETALKKETVLEDFIMNHAWRWRYSQKRGAMMTKLDVFSHSRTRIYCH